MIPETLHLECYKVDEVTTGYIGLVPIFKCPREHKVSILYKSAPNLPGIKAPEELTSEGREELLKEGKAAEIGEGTLNDGEAPYAGAAKLTIRILVQLPGAVLQRRMCLSGGVHNCLVAVVVRGGKELYLKRGLGGRRFHQGGGAGERSAYSTLRRCGS